MPPKLLLPVEVDVLPEPGSGGVGSGWSSRFLCTEPFVEDLPRLLNMAGAASMGEDLPDRFDVVESLRKLG